MFSSFVSNLRFCNQIGVIMTLEDLKALLMNQTSHYIEGKRDDLEGLKVNIIAQSAIAEVMEQVLSVLDKKCKTDIKEKKQGLQKHFLDLQVRTDNQQQIALHHELETIESALPGLEIKLSEAEGSYLNHQAEFRTSKSLSDASLREVEDQRRVISYEEREKSSLDRKIHNLQRDLSDARSRLSQSEDRLRAPTPPPQVYTHGSSFGAHHSHHTHPAAPHVHIGGIVAHPYQHVSPQFHTHGGLGNTYSSHAVSADISIWQTKISRLESEIDSLQNQVAKKRQDLAHLRERIDRLTREHRSLNAETMRLKHLTDSLEIQKNSIEKAVFSKQRRIPEIRQQLSAITDREFCRQQSTFEMNQLSSDNQRSLREQLEKTRRKLNNECIMNKTTAEQLSYTYFIEKLKTTRFQEDCNLLAIVDAVEQHITEKKAASQQESNMQQLQSQLAYQQGKRTRRQKEVTTNKAEIKRIDSKIQELTSHTPQLKEQAERYKKLFQFQKKGAIGLTVSSVALSAAVVSLFFFASIAPILLATVFVPPVGITAMVGLGLVVAALVNNARHKSTLKNINSEAHKTSSLEQEKARIISTNQQLEEKTIPELEGQIAQLETKDIPEQQQILENISQKADDSLRRAQTTDVSSKNYPLLENSIFSPAYNPQSMDPSSAANAPAHSAMPPYNPQSTDPSSAANAPALSDDEDAFTPKFG